jgi:hypothetical protein
VGISTHEGDVPHRGNHGQPAARVIERPRASLAALLMGLRDIRGSSEPAVVFDRVAELCVEVLADGCLLSILEDGEGRYHLRRGWLSGAGTPEKAEVLGARHECGGDSVVIPVSPPELDGERTYRGRLELFWRRRRPDQVDVSLAQVVVDHAVDKLHNARLAALLRTDRARLVNLEVALQSNRGIGVAMGILMAQHKIPEDVAFHLLRRASQIAHRKLRDVADEVIFTGGLPSHPARRSA